MKRRTGIPGDPAHGAPLYDRCIACHALGYNRTGPRHCGLFGAWLRQATTESPDCRR